ncbi:MAG: hypothetical protein IIX96_02070 [Clostridia bacterium]|nr:hypothetical protein [Clostridia bacterium]
MKKIIVLLLAFACTFSLFACGEGGAEAFVEIVNASEPTKIITQTSYTTSEYTLSGRFETEISGGDFVFTYDYQRLATIEEGVADGDNMNYIKPVAGKVYYKEGLYSTDNESWTTEIPETGAIQVFLKLNAKKLGKCYISDDGKTLVATVTPENAEAMLGVELGATEDGVEMTIKHDGALLREIVVEYATENAKSVIITTSYSYGVVV